MEEAAVTLSGLTPLVPQPRHKPAKSSRFPWSEASDCMFRNEGATGSNPVSSTNFGYLMKGVPHYCLTKP